MNAAAAKTEVQLIGSPYDLRVSLGERVGEAGIKEALETGDTGFVHSMTNGMPVTLSRATEVISQYRVQLATMKGGLTISGGEPLMQHRFVLKVFGAAKEMGVHTALDSNGYLGDRLSEADLASIDLVLLDL